jgi:transcriptional regulator with XRE-family HTH domain
MNNLASRLKQLREQHGLTQAELAKRAGLRGQSLIGNLEAGIRKSSRHLPRIAQALGVHAIWLAEGKGQQDANTPANHSANEPTATYAATPELDPRQRALLGLFAGLTTAQQDEEIRRLETQKQQNDAVIEELTGRRANGK